MQTKSITKNHHFKHLYSRGKYNVSPYFALYTRQNRPHEPQDTNFLGITVGVKVGNAVTRNQIKRRIKAIYRLQEPQLKQGHHIVVVARNRCAKADYAKMEQSLCKLFDQLELSKNPKVPPKFIMGSGPNPKQKNSKGKQQPKGKST